MEKKLAKALGSLGFHFHEFLQLCVNSAFSMVRQSIPSWPFTFLLTMGACVHLVFHGHIHLWQEDDHGMELMVSRHILGFHNSKLILDPLMP